LEPKPDPSAPATPPRANARKRILAAAVELAHDIGAANLSLDAVAARAGVSKGGLLYHFPSKLALLEALVETHLREFESRLDSRQPDRIAETYVAASFADCRSKSGKTSGVLAAMVENPEMMAPIRRFKRRILDRLKDGSTSDADALMLFLAVDGLRGLQLFDMDILTPDEIETVEKSLMALCARTRPLRRSA
jgi:AcrR family transcriptional regulator